jgi:hypothetical protein
MATEDFEIRFAKIKEKLHTFHGNFLQENTINILNPKQLKELLPKLQQIYDTLMHFLAHCLENNGCDSSTIRFIVSTNAGSDDDAKKLEKLLHSLCPEMSPWDANMNAEVSHLCKQFIEYPFSINASHRVDGPGP